MTEEQKAQLKRYVETWKRIGPELERMKEEEVRQTDMKKAIRRFDGLLAHAVRTHPPEATSGLVEQQRIFMKIAGRKGCD